MIAIRVGHAVVFHMRICGCGLEVNSSVPPDWINDFENVNCTNCECSFMLSDDLITIYQQIQMFAFVGIW